jgi:hypothetical protein
MIMLATLTAHEHTLLLPTTEPKQFLLRYQQEALCINLSHAGGLLCM